MLGGGDRGDPLGVARRVVVDRARRRPLLGPGLEIAQFVVGRDAVAVARRHASAASQAAGFADSGERFKIRPMTKPLVPRALLDPIVEYFKPQRVILFGSKARGEAGRDSDIDLMVV